MLGRERRRAGSRAVRSESKHQHPATSSRLQEVTVQVPLQLRYRHPPACTNLDRRKELARPAEAVEGVGVQAEPARRIRNRDQVDDGGFGRVEFWRRGSLCTPGDAGKRCWLDDPRLHRHLTSSDSRQDDAPRFLLMVRMDITLNVIPPCHLRGSAEMRTVTLKLGTSPSVVGSRAGSSGALC